MNVLEILKTEFSEDFIEKMKNAMITSYHKYGPVVQGFPERVHALDSMAARLRKYAATGNKEYLVDAANFLMIEFMHPRHEKAHWQSEDSAKSPGRVMTDTGRLEHLDNAGRDLAGGFSSASAVANMRHQLRDE